MKKSDVRMMTKDEAKKLIVRRLKFFGKPYKNSPSLRVTVEDLRRSLQSDSHKPSRSTSNGNTANAVLAAEFHPLKQKQIYQLTAGKKHWSEKKQHLIKLAKNFGITITTDEELKYLVEVHCPNEERRIRKQFFIDSQTGKIKTHLTPTDVKGNFTKITRPVIGLKYHISWAFSGAVFKLVKIEGDICYLDNPKYKRKQLLTCKVSELRGLR